MKFFSATALSINSQEWGYCLHAPYRLVASAANRPGQGVNSLGPISGSQANSDERDKCKLEDPKFFFLWHFQGSHVNNLWILSISPPLFQA